MNKRLLSIGIALLVLFYSFPQEIFADVFFSFTDNDAVCAQIPKSAAVLNLLDISKKISVGHFNTEMDSFLSLLVPELCKKPAHLSPLQDAEFNNLKLYTFTAFSRVLKNRKSSVKFSADDHKPLILYEDGGILVSQILLHLKSVIRATAPSDDINIIISNKIHINPACV